MQKYFYEGILQLKEYFESNEHLSIVTEPVDALSEVLDNLHHFEFCIGLFCLLV
jgi:hypothetical protein